MNYDYLISLGENCSAAHNVRLRDMRRCSLPFDWIYMDGPQPLAYLAEGFANDFAQLCRIENLVQIAGTEDHPRIVRDSHTGFCFPNHFASDDIARDFPAVRKEFDRRIDRLVKILSTSSKVLFLLAGNIRVSDEAIQKIAEAVRKRYPNLAFDFHVLNFGCAAEAERKGTTVGGTLTVQEFVRPQNRYDFIFTNFEWRFLDTIRAPRCRPRDQMNVFSLRCLGRRLKLVLSWRPLQTRRSEPAF